MAPEMSKQAVTANRRVECATALLLVSQDGRAACANPSLSMMLRFAPEISRYPAVDLVTRYCAESGRDRLIKDLVRVSYEPQIRGEIAPIVAALDDTCSRWNDLLGPGFALILEAKAERLRLAAEPFVRDIDPVSDLHALTGARLQMRTVVCPSLFLPPPQDGRHGVTVRGPDGTPVIHLHFGFPLEEDPANYGIRRDWVLGGAWHYAIEEFLDLHWEPIGRALKARPEMGAVVVDTMGPRHRERSASAILRIHLNIALKCHLSRRIGAPEGIHLAFANARGLVLFKWFDEWLQRILSRPGCFGRGIAALPDALWHERDVWREMARRARYRPPSINLALIAQAGREDQPVIVVPDAWRDEDIEALAARWLRLCAHVLRHSDYINSPAFHGRPVIGFGEPGSTPLLPAALPGVGAGDSLFVSLHVPDDADSTWRMAVVVDRPDSALAFTPEIALGLPYKAASLRGSRVVAGEAAALAGV